MLWCALWSREFSLLLAFHTGGRTSCLSCGCWWKHSCLVLLWYNLTYSLAFSLYVSLCLKLVSLRQHSGVFLLPFDGQSFNWRIIASALSSWLICLTNNPPFHCSSLLLYLVYICFLVFWALFGHYLFT